MLPQEAGVRGAGKEEMAAFREGARVCSGRRVTLRDSQRGSVGLLLGFQTAGATCYQYQGCHLKNQGESIVACKVILV